MADYKKIIELRPEVTDFVRARHEVRYRGEALCYAPDLSRDSFSTDNRGYRHTVLGSRNLSADDCVASDRYGLVLGASNVFGFGVPGNENTMASRLSERFGFPVANISMPGANSRNLHATLLGFLTARPTPPAFVVHSSGGDLSSFCASSIADSVFGSPNRGQLKVLEESVRFDPERTFPNVLAFTAMWTTAIAKLCRAAGVPIVLTHQSTFFEKARPSAIERESGLGKPFPGAQERQFANHRKYNAAFFQRRKEIADGLDMPLTGWGLSDRLGYIDEFHCDRAGIALLSKAAGDAIEPLL